MNILLWVLQVLLALAFFAHGWLFLFPPASLVDEMNASLPRWFQLFIGVAEVLAAVGLTLPGLTRIQPWLISCAAAGFAAVVTQSAVIAPARMAPQERKLRFMTILVRRVTWGADIPS